MGGKCKLSGLKKRHGKRGNKQFVYKKPEEEDGVRERKRCGGCGEKWKFGERERGLQIIFSKFVGMIARSHKTCRIQTTLLILL